MFKFDISIVIATYNRGEKLLATLGSLTAMDMPAHRWEVVVVNNNSTDNTEEIFSDFCRLNNGFNIRMVFEPRQGLSYARNSGIAQASGRIIAIIDDDELVNREFAGAYVEFFDSHPTAAAAGGKIIPHYEQLPPRWISPIAERPIAGSIDMGDKPAAFRGGRYPGGGNMAVRREIFEKYGVFDPRLGRTGTKLMAGEEKDFFRRITQAGESVYYVPGAQIRHIIPPSRLTREHFIKLCYMVGVSERVRTRSMSSGAYCLRLVSEAAKWGATLLLALYYTVSLQPLKGAYLFLLRREITRGLLGLERR